jgi:DNA-binding NarL/FixJ family response regulator
VIRLLLADDHQIVREALRSVLEKEPDIEIAGEAGDGETTLTLARDLAPDIVVMDIAMPGINGIEATRRIIAANPAIRVLALSTYFDRSFVIQMLEAGATGYISKAAGRDELLRGIRSVAAGKPYLCQDIAAMLVKNPSGGEEGGGERLGRREIQVLQLIADGKTSAEIGAQLYISTSTVEVHRRNIMRKLDLHSVAELTKYAIRQGLVSA